MAESVLSNLRVRGTLTAVGLTALAAITGTTLVLSGSLTGTTASFSGTATGARLEVRPASGSGIVRIRSVPGGTGTGGFLCIEDLTGSVDLCYSSGGRLDCDTDTRSLCS